MNNKKHKKAPLSAQELEQHVGGIGIPTPPKAKLPKPKNAADRKVAKATKQQTRKVHQSLLVF